MQRLASSGFGGLALGALGLLLSACASSPRRAPVAAPAPGYPTPAPSSAVEGFGAPRAPRQVGSAWLFLPGNAAQQQVNFATVDGQAVLEGDIMLGPATTLPLRYGIPWQSTLERKGAVAVASRSYLWPDGEVPYVVDGSAQDKLPAITWALRAFDGTPLRFRPGTASDRDYVVFRRLNSGCWSYLGRQGGPQDIDVTTCAGGNIAHELMHAAGFYHEQSRGDRDDFVSIVWDEIAPEMRSNFDKRDARGQDIGPYDYASIMHYGSHAGSRSGRPTIIPRAANARIGQRDGLSALDRAALETLYPTRSQGSARPAVIPPATNPPPVAVPASQPASAPPPSPVAVPTPPSLPAPPSLPPTAPSAPAPAPAPSAAAASFTGSYSSARGAVSCSQGGLFVQCTYPGGSLFCAANGPELACTWNGGGQGRAAFQRQSSGVLAGTYGDGFSANSRGAWDLVPSAPPGAPAPAPASASSPAPAPPTAAAAPSAAASLSGRFTSTRGDMSCTEAGASVSCNFQEPDGVGGRLDCAKSQNALELSCAWMTFFPRPATGRARFTRRSVGERNLSGNWGTFLADTGGGRWDTQAR